MNLLDFGQPTCVKCGASREEFAHGPSGNTIIVASFKITYMLDHMLDEQNLVDIGTMGESKEGFMLIECWRCHYKWAEKPADAH